MAALQSYNEDNFQRDAFPATETPEVGAAWDANVLLVTHHPRAPPSPPWRPLPVQQLFHVIEPQNDVFQPANIAGNRQHDNHWGGIPSPIENIALRGQPQDAEYNNMDYHFNYPPPTPEDLAAPRGHNHRAINNARVAQGVPAQAQAIAPPVPDIEILDNAGQHAAAGLAQAPLNEWPNRVPIFNEPAREVLRRLANCYLNEPYSHIDMIHMEPGPAGGTRVVITLELADLP